MKHETRRMDQYLNDKHLIKLNAELTRLQVTLFKPGIVYDEELQAEKVIAIPIIPNANELIGMVQMQINEYTKATYPDLFPGKS